MKKLMQLLLLCLATVPATAQIQKSHILIYKLDGKVDTLLLNNVLDVYHSRRDVNGVEQPDVSTLRLRTIVGERVYPLTEIDHVVMPKSRRVVSFVGTAQPEPETAAARQFTSVEGDFPGSVGDAVIYEWVTGDRIFLANGERSRAVEYPYGNISYKSVKGEFSFESDTLVADRYTIFYPGSASNIFNQVTIPAVQSQARPNNSDHLGSSGDCGWAVAVRQPNSEYLFRLNHESAIFCFIPRVDSLKTLVLKDIAVKAANGRMLAGQFTLSTDGIILNNGTGSDTVYLGLGGANYANPFHVPNNKVMPVGAEWEHTPQDSVAAYMVVAPQTESTPVKVYYHLYDTKSLIDTTVVKDITFTQGIAAQTLYPITSLISSELFFKAFTDSVKGAAGNVEWSFGAPARMYGSVNMLYQNITTGIEWTNERDFSTLLGSQELTANKVDRSFSTLSEAVKYKPYYYRAYADFNGKRYYGEVKKYGLEREAINMGTGDGLKWSSINLGSVTAEDVGDHYAWGETVTKTTYTLDTYDPLGNGAGVYDKIGSDISGLTQFDPAAKIWRGCWRMPTQTETQRLLNSSNVTRVTQNNVQGYLLASKSYSDSTIFVPFESDNHCHWTATEYDNSRACDWWNMSANFSSNINYKYYGRTIRPVYDSNVTMDDGTDMYLRSDSIGYSADHTSTIFYGTMRGLTDEDETPVIQGFVIGTVADVTLASDATIKINSYYQTASDNGLYHCNMSEADMDQLELGQRYFVRAYFTRKDQTVYGDAMMMEALTLTTDSTNWQVGMTSARLCGYADGISDRHVSTTELGFVVGLTPDVELDVADAIRCVSDSTGNGKFVSVVDGLELRQYYYRAYILQGGRVFYGDPKMLGLEMIDLGLPSGLKWANINIGAQTPMDTGDYFAWGEVKPHSNKDYRQATYDPKSDGMNVYDNIGTDINGTQYDAAQYNWKNTWRMPTCDDVKELYDNCEATLTTLYGANVWKYTSKHNGKSIYLRAGGYYNNGYINDNSGRRAIYWTSTDYNNSNYAWYYSSGYNNDEKNSLGGWYRHCGMLVRPVTEPNDVLDNGDDIRLVTGDVNWQVGQTTATLHGYVLGLQYNSEATESGILYSTGHFNDFTDGVFKLKTNEGEITKVANGNYQCIMTSVTDNTVYYYRAYVLVGGKYYLGEEREFGRRMVDLGLPSGTIWSNINVGASSPDDSGDYYAWAETTTKSDYSVSTYSYDVKTTDISGSSHDAAYVKWGGLWRMPTSEDLRQLIDRCQWTAVVKYGQPMFKVTGPSGDSIFIARSGYKEGTSTVHADDYVSLWTSILDDSGDAAKKEAYGANIRVNSNEVETIRRHLGMNIRPVAKYTHTLPDQTKIYVSTDSTDWQVGISQPRLIGAAYALPDGAERGFVVGYDSTVTANSDATLLYADVTGNDIVVSDTDDTFRGTVAYIRDTTFYYRAYVKINGQYYYGKARRYGLELIDLGFGDMKWASINVGAQYDACVGDRYAWGETSVKTNYSQSSYKYYDNGYEFLGDSISGTRFDVAKAKWGDDWRMPTRREMQMLVDSCDWQWTTVDGQNGYLLTSKKNQHKLFLPAAGYQSTTFYNAVGDECYYWTATRNGDAQAGILHADGSSYLVSAANRFLGISVRPVKKAVPDEPGKGITGGHQQGGAQQTEANQNTAKGNAGTGKTGGTVTPN